MHMDLPELAELDREVEELLRQVAALAERDLAPEQFYAQLLERAVFGLAASGGSAWACTPQRQFEALAALGPETAQTAERLALLNAALEQPTLLVPAESSAAVNGLVNNSPWLLVLGRVCWSGQPVALLEIRQRPSVSFAAQQGYARFVAALCELAERYHQRLEQRRWQGQVRSARELDALALAVHRSLGVDATAVAIANEGRRWLGADRLMVCTLASGVVRARATSGVDVLDRRAPIIAALEALGNAAAATEEDLDLPADDLPPPLEHAVRRAVDVGQAKAISLAFLRSQDTSDGANASFGLLVAEWLREAPPAREGRERLGALGRHAAASLANALEHESVPLARWLTPWAARPGRMPKRPARKALVALALVCAVAAALSLVPAEYRLSASGELWPQTKRNVFAPAAAVVETVHITHGQKVTAGESLVTLRDPKLEFELARVQGSLETARKRLASIQAERITGLPEGDDAFAKFQQRTAEEEEVKSSLAMLEQQLAILRRQEQELTLRAPIAGEVLTWRPDQLLAGRPVERGQLLLRVADVAGPWIVEARVPQDYAGDLQAARVASAGELPVTFALLTDPTQNFRGRLVDLANVVELDAEDEPAVELAVAIDEPPPAPRAGAGVLARIECGPRPWGYVLFHDAARAAASWWY
ncbi:MAG: HlyD family efflux transporter periplasmic adaptor subunit [Pirellulales bacterium]